MCDKNVHNQCCLGVNRCENDNDPPLQQNMVFFFQDIRIYITNNDNGTLYVKKTYFHVTSLLYSIAPFQNKQRAPLKKKSKTFGGTSILICG